GGAGGPGRAGGREGQEGQEGQAGREGQERQERQKPSRPAFPALPAYPAFPACPASLGLIPSTNTRPSRAPSSRTDLNPSASSALVASPDATNGGPVCVREISAPRPPRGVAPTIITRPPGRNTRTSSRIATTRSSARI